MLLLLLLMMLGKSLLRMRLSVDAQLERPHPAGGLSRVLVVVRGAQGESRRGLEIPLIVIVIVIAILILTWVLSLASALAFGRTSVGCERGRRRGAWAPRGL